MSATRPISCGRSPLVCALALALSGCGPPPAPPLPELAPPSLSPDGHGLVFGVRRGTEAFLVRYDLAGQQAWRITPASLAGGEPVWSRRQQAVVFSRVEGPRRHLWLMRPDGTDLRRLTEGEVCDRALLASPDGQSLYFVRQNWRGRLLLPGREVWQVSLAPGSAQPTLVGVGCAISADGRKRVTATEPPGTLQLIEAGATATKFVGNGFSPSLSPDGSKLAYVTLATNWQREVRVRDLVAGHTALLATTAGNSSPPRFSPDGSTLLWLEAWPGTNQTTITLCTLSNQALKRVVIHLEQIGS